MSDSKGYKPQIDEDDRPTPRGDEDVVEALMKVRQTKGVDEYWVKWKGWDIADNTWEPLADIKLYENGPAAIKQWESSQNTAAAKPAATSTPQKAAKPAETDARQNTDRDNISIDVVMLGGTASYCFEGDNIIIWVIRFGKGEGSCTVDYATELGQGMSKDLIKEAKGTLSFEPGEKMKKVEIQTMDDDLWNAERFFMFKLTGSGGNCRLGRLTQTICKIVDNDSWPGPKGGNILQHFVLERWRATRAGSQKTAANLAYHSIHWFLITFGNKQIIDKGITENNHSAIVNWLIVFLVSFSILHYVDKQKLTHGEIGGSIHYLRSNLMRKFLTFSELSIPKYPDTSVLTAISRNTETAVKEAYGQCFQIWENLLLMTVQFLLGLGLLTSWGTTMVSTEELHLLGMLLFLPGGCVVVMHFFSPQVNKAKANRQRCMDDFFNAMTELLTQRRMICNFNTREQRYGFFDVKVAAFKKSEVALNKATLNATKALEWVAMMVTIFVVLIGTSLVLDPTTETHVGTYVAILSIFKGISTAIQKIFSSLLTISAAQVPLEKIAGILNTETDSTQRMVAQNKNILQLQPLLHKETLANHIYNKDSKLMDVFDEADGGTKFIGLLPIALNSVTYHYDLGEVEDEEGDVEVVVVPSPPPPIEDTHVSPSKKWGAVKAAVVVVAETDPPPIEGKKRSMDIKWDGVKSALGLGKKTERSNLRTHRLVDELLHSTSLTFSQGTFNVVIGAAGDGKNTFLRLLGGEIFPSSGEIFVPSILTTLFIPLDSQMFEGSLMDNLKMATPDIPDEQVWVLCKEIRVLLKYVDKPDAKVQLHGSNFTKSDQVGVALVRAFLQEPDFLVLERPTSYFSTKHTEHILELFREYVDNRGLKCMERFYNFKSVKPKTIVITTKDNEAPTHVDVDGILMIKDRTATLLPGHKKGEKQLVPELSLPGPDPGASGRARTPKGSVRTPKGSLRLGSARKAAAKAGDVSLGELES